MNPTQLSSIFFGFPLILVPLYGCSVSKEMSTESIPAVKSFDLQKYLGTWY